MMQQRMAIFLCLPVFCLAVWALFSSAHAQECEDQSVSETLGSKAEIKDDALSVCDMDADGNAAYVWWNEGVCNKNTPTNRLQIGGNGKCKHPYVFPPGTGWVTFRACVHDDPGFDECGPWVVVYIP